VCGSPRRGVRNSRDRDMCQVEHCPESYYLHKPEKKLHEENCFHQLAKCVVCADMIPLTRYEEHIKGTHPDRGKNGNGSVGYSIPKNTMDKREEIPWMYHFFESNKTKFMHQFIKKNDSFYFLISCMASKSISSKFVCTLEVFSKANENTMKISKICLANSIVSSFEEVYSTSNYLQIDLNTIKSFLGSSDSIGSKVTIRALE